MALLVAIVAAAVLGGGYLGAEAQWRSAPRSSLPRRSGSAPSPPSSLPRVGRLRSRRLVQGDLGVARAIEEVKMGLEEDTEELIVPEWFGGFGDKEVVEMKSKMEPVKDWQSSSGWTRKQPTASKGRKTLKKSQGSSQLIPLTRNKDANKGSGGDDETRPQPAMSIVKRRRKPEKKKGGTFLEEEKSFLGEEKYERPAAARDPWLLRAQQAQTTMAPTAYQDYGTSANLGPTSTDKQSLQIGEHSTTSGGGGGGGVRGAADGGLQDFFPVHSPQQFFGRQANGGDHAKRCRVLQVITNILNLNKTHLKSQFHSIIKPRFQTSGLNYGFQVHQRCVPPNHFKGHSRSLQIAQNKISPT